MSNLPDICIGDFAEDLLLGEIQNIQEGKAPPPNLSNTVPADSPVQGKQVDISNVQVPDNIMDMWTGNASFNPQASVIEEKLS